MSKKINLVSYGNGWSIGSKTGDPLYSFGKKDSLYKKNLHEHPTNLYNTWIDYIAMRIDASVYYNGRDNIIPLLAMDRSIKTIKDNKFNKDTNIHIVNISFPINDMFLSKSATFDPSDNVANIIEFKNRDKHIFLNKLSELAETATDNHKILVVFPYIGLYENVVVDVELKNTLSKLHHDNFYSLPDDLSHYCKDFVLEEKQEFLTKDQHTSIGKNVFGHLTNEANFLTI
jgi:hypothetical protein